MHVCKTKKRQRRVTENPWTSELSQPLSIRDVFPMNISRWDVEPHDQKCCLFLHRQPQKESGGTAHTQGQSPLYLLYLQREWMCAGVCVCSYVQVYNCGCRLLLTVMCLVTFAEDGCWYERVGRRDKGWDPGKDTLHSSFSPTAFSLLPLPFSGSCSFSLTQGT